MMQHLQRILITYLTLALAFAWPLASHAEGRKRVILIPVSDESDSKALPGLKNQIEQLLGQSQKFSVVTSDLKGTGGIEVPGDVIYLDGERQFLNLEYDNAIKTSKLALAQFAKNPGMQGGINKVWVLQAQVFLKQGKLDSAADAFSQSIAVGVFLKELDSYFYPQPIRVAYSKAYQEYIAKTSLTELTIRVKSDKNVPIYLNGAKIGTGPQVQVSVPTSSVQLVAAGNPSAITRIEVPKKNHPLAVQLEEKAIKQAGSMNRIDDALSLGQSVGADMAVMISLEKDRPNHKLNLRVVDIEGRSATPVTKFEIAHLQNDFDSAAAAASHHVLSVPEKKFAEINGKKKKTPKALLIGVISVLVVGAGVGAALALGGGGGGSDSSTINVGSPTPSARK